MYAIPAFLNDLNPANLSNPSSLQINSQLFARGAGGRGEALGIRPHPAGVAGRVDGFPASSSFKFLTQILRAQGVRPAGPRPQSLPKSHKKSNQKKVQNFDSN